MMRRAIVLVLSGVALSGCTGIPSMPSFSVPSFKMPSFSMPGFNAPGMPVHVSSIPPGADASFGSGGESCRTPCTLAAPNGTGTYNVSFTLEGYQPQSIPVRIAVNEGGSLQSGDAGTSPTTVISPNPVFAELEPVAPAASTAAKRPPAARTKPPAKPAAAKPAATTAATAPSGSASSPPPPAPPALPSPLGTPAPATSPNVFR
jgi:PEGA domain